MEEKTKDKKESKEVKNLNSLNNKEVSAANESEKKTEKKVSDKKVDKIVWDVAVANAPSLVISPKHAFAVCKMIRGKTPDRAIEMLDLVVLGKQPVKMTGREVAHQKGKGIAGAKFPKNAAIAIKEVVKQVKANALNLGIEFPVITIAMANKASAPARRGGRKGKRTHVHLEVMEKTKFVKKKK